MSGFGLCVGVGGGVDMYACLLVPRIDAYARLAGGCPTVSGFVPVVLSGLSRLSGLR